MNVPASSCLGLALHLHWSGLLGHCETQMELLLGVINHRLGRESVGLPAQKEIFPEYFSPLPAEEMMFLH